MSRLIGLMILGLLALSSPATASPSVAHTTYEAIGLEGHPSLEVGRVLDVTHGVDHGAMERHVVAGARADTTYSVIGHVFFAPDCALGSIAVPEGVITTGPSGSGSLTVRFPGEALAGAPNRFWVRWELEAGTEVAYRSGCVEVTLDD